MTRTSIPRPRRMAAAGLLLLFAWSALMPVLYRMDCINSGRSVSSWFEPITCQPAGFDAAGKALAPACCIFYKADASDGPNESIQPTPVHQVVGMDVLMAAFVVIRHGHRPAARFISDHGPPPLDLGQRLARLSFLRV